MKTITKKQLNKIYKKKVNPLDPFERLRVLMDYAISTLQKSNLKKQAS